MFSNKELAILIDIDIHGQVQPQENDRIHEQLYEKGESKLNSQQNDINQQQ